MKGEVHSLRFRILVSVLAGAAVLVGSLGYLLLRANQENTHYVLEERLILAYAVQRAVDAEILSAHRTLQRLAQTLGSSGEEPVQVPAGTPVDGVTFLPRGSAPEPTGPAPVSTFLGSSGLEVVVAARLERGWLVGRISEERLARLLVPPRG